MAPGPRPRSPADLAAGDGRRSYPDGTAGGWRFKSWNRSFLFGFSIGTAGFFRRRVVSSVIRFSGHGQDDQLCRRASGRTV